MPFLSFVVDKKPNDKLAEIMAHKRREVERIARPVRDFELERLARLKAAGEPGFIEALERFHGLAVIAEIKRKSPSAGQIAEMPDATEQARAYTNAGVNAMSVLTDEEFFGGSLRDLWEVTDFLTRHPRGIPCLRKDFMVHPVQVVEAAEAGARCILIIMRALEDQEILRLSDAAGLAGLDVLWEVHSEAELERCLRFGPHMIGVNNRDLARFQTDLAFSERIIPQIPAHILSVSESGIFTAADAARVRAAGARAILVGEALMRAEDTDALVEELQEC